MYNEVKIEVSLKDCSNNMHDMSVKEVADLELQHWNPRSLERIDIYIY
jgi:hypothetical protein